MSNQGKYIYKNITQFPHRTLFFFFSVAFSPKITGKMPRAEADDDTAACGGMVLDRRLRKRPVFFLGENGEAPRAFAKAVIAVGG